MTSVCDMSDSHCRTLYLETIHPITPTQGIECETKRNGHGTRGEGRREMRWEEGQDKQSRLSMHYSIYSSYSGSSKACKNRSDRSLAL